MALPQILPPPAEDPVSAAEFAAAMAAFGPFESAPHLAAAVSGGRDSMALALLADSWARARGARVTALTVDHALRPESAIEARQVAAWCRARGIDHAILRRDGPAFASAIQDAARQARYRLLEEWCAAHAVLHLLVAHQREDQAETVLMRQARGSGVVGLAGIASTVERVACRVLRPLLDFSRARLAAFLDAAGQTWLDDPSNRNSTFLRVRLRADLDAVAPREAAVARLAGLAGEFARLRIRLEAETARCLAQSVTIDPAGFAWLDGSVLAAAGEAGRRALAAVIVTVSGSAYPPRGERLQRLFDCLPDRLAGGRSLGGCLILPRRGRILVCREPAAMAPAVAALPGARARWDDRFALDLGPGGAGLRLGALGHEAVTVLADAAPGACARVPAAAQASLPALHDAKGVVAVPALEYVSKSWPEAAPGGARLIFSPKRALTDGGFTIV
jgi:tRNA(Ile)-lysidine synthase